MNKKNIFDSFNTHLSFILCEEKFKIIIKHLEVITKL